MEFHEARLANGLQVIAEHSPSVYSAAVGFFVRTGARDETDEISGVSHFLEHMVFKGTARHSADDVNRVFDEVGAKYNASTSEEITLFYGAVLPEYLPRTFDLLADILRPSLRQEDFDMEKKVILEEIGMYDDQPTYTAYEHLMQAHFSGHPLGRSVLGTNESITALTCEQMRAYHKTRYVGGNIILAVAGKFDWPQVLSLAEQYCSDWPAGGGLRKTTEARPQGGLKLVQKPNSMLQHVMHMAPAPTAASPLRYAADILTVIVGDDSGSRLFWELVDPGFAETADVGFNEFDGSGAYIGYFSCPPEEAQKNLARIQAIYDDVNKNGVTEVELNQAKSKIASRIVLRSERPMGRLAALGHNWVNRSEYHRVADDLEILRQIKLADIRRLLEQYPLRQLTTSTVGPLDELRI
ncbi:MAG: insulinase family protein [Planctomycetes bacterium]|nr:insulinase family protein [Planctomycetota bacterium]